VIRFRLDRALCALLEITAVLAYGYWGWAVHGGLARYAWAVGAMFVAATVWDVFRVPGDGLKPTVRVPGWVRLIIEAGYFTGVATSLAAAGLPGLGIIFAILVALHYAVTHERVAWLLNAREDTG
jgi:hypothetical protein